MDWSALLTGGTTTGIASGLGISLLILILVVAVLQGLSLWKAARLKDNVWFWILIFVHTLGILNVIYLILKRKEKV